MRSMGSNLKKRRETAMMTNNANNVTQHMKSCLPSGRERVLAPRVQARMARQELQVTAGNAVSQAIVHRTVTAKHNLGRTLV